MNELSNVSKRNGARGFTLIEIMIVAALFIIIATFIFTLFIATIRTAATQDAIIGMRDEARLTAERSIQLIRGATNLLGVDINGNVVAIAGNVPAGGRAARVTFRYPQDLDGDFAITTLAELTGNMTLGLDLFDEQGNDADGLTSTDIILLDDDGDILNRFTDRAVPTTVDPDGGFVLEYLGNDRYELTITLRSTDVQSFPMEVTERRVFTRKNVF